MAKDELHELIHSLIPAEKRYFKLHAARSGKGASSSYFLLFNLLDQMPIFDKAKIQTVFNWKHFGTNYASRKKYLYNLILDCLENYRVDHTAYQKIERKIRHIRLLISRGLFEHAYRRIKQAKKLAQKFHHPILIYQLTKLERELIGQGKVGSFKTETLVHKHAEIQDSLEQLRILAKLNEIRYRFFAIKNQFGSTVNPEQEELIQQLVTHPVLEQVKDHYGLTTHYCLSRIKSQYAYMQGNFAEALAHCQQFHLRWKDATAIIPEYESLYLSSVHNYLNMCLFEGNFEEGKPLLQSLRNFHPKNDKYKVTRFESLAVFQLVWRSTFRESAADSMEEVFEGLRHFEDKLNLGFTQNIYCLLSVNYFLDEDFQAALQWVHKMMELNSRSGIVQFRRMGHLFYLMIHYELGNFDLLGFQIRNYTQQVKGKELYRFETLFLNHMGQLINLPTSAHAAQFQHFATKLALLFEDPNEVTVFSFFNFLPWAKAKSTGRPVRQLIWEENGQV